MLYKLAMSIHVLYCVYRVCCIILFYLQQQQSAGSLTWQQRLGWLGIRITITSNTQYKPRQ